MKHTFIYFACLFGLLSGCIIDAEVRRDELNIWARNPEISRETKIFRLIEIIEDTDEDPHYRATAVKLAGELKIAEAVEPLFLILGENVTKAEDSELLRLEAVSALGSFGDPAIYRRMMLLIYTNASWESASNIRRFFIQSFEAVPTFKEDSHITRTQALAVELLIEMLKTANTRNEDQSIVYMINNRLKLISGHTELTPRNIDAWIEVKIKMLKDVRND